MNKNKPSVSKPTEDKDDLSQSPPSKRDRRQSERRERDRRESDKGRDDSDSNLSNPQQDVVPIQNGPGLAPNMWGSMMGTFVALSK